MKMGGSRRTLVPGAIALLCLAAAASVARAARDEPQQVVVQHILIGFKGKVPGKDIERSKQEAKALAEELLRRAEAGEDFGQLVEQYTDDRAPGIYKIANRGQARPPDGVSRDQLVPSFGDVAFRLKVGEIGMAKYHAALSPFGWHVIQRLE